MILLSLFGRTRPYTSKEVAHKAAAFFLNHHVVDCQGRMDGKAFKSALQREDYESCVNLWNDFVLNHMYGDSVHRATIEEVELDKPFT